ncbi:hypothetical protein ACPPVV_09790 [Rhodanobacter sp. Col0626]|uniref:hypothetical protein n=1 Tax=Rhodanobacter sp. Col0626 TaxID=3415679 RepID=UPI003CF7DBA7
MITSLPPREPDDNLPDEAGLKALYDQLPRNEPGPALDAAVLRAAAQALSAQPHAGRPAFESGSSPTRKRNSPRWLIGLSSVATLVLAAGLAWHMRGMPQADTAPAAANDVVSEKATTPAMAPQAAPVAAKPEAMPQVPPPPPEPAKQPPPKFVRPLSSAKLAASPHTVLQTVGMARRNSTASFGSQASPVAAPNAPAPVAEVSGNAFSMADAAAPAPPSIQGYAMPPPSPAPASDAPAAQAASPAQARELTEIRRLFAEHKDRQAQQRLEQFHRAHPRWQFAADLEARLPKP